MSVIWTARATRDLIDIHRYISHDKPKTATRWIHRIRHRAKNAAENPLFGRIVSELQQAEIREVLLGDYRIVYQILDNDILILTVFNGHRLFPSIT